MTALRPSRPFSGGELALAWAALLIAGVLVYLPHVIHGGFYLDDWSNGALTLHNPGGSSFGDVISSYADATLFRPVLVIYVPLTYWVFGMTLWLHIAWASLLGISVSGLLYAVLRTLGIPWIHALAIAGLVLMYPWFDSTRLWITADQISLSSAFALGGLWFALAGLRRDSWRWHLAAVALYLLSILTYEIATPAIAAFGLLYIWRFGWERARWRWAADIIVILAGGIWVLSHTTRTTGGLSGHLDHLKMILEGGAEILGRTALPFGPQQTVLPLALLCLVLGLGAVALWRWPLRFPRGGENSMGLGRWLGLSLAGLLLAGLGWVVFVPADPYYTPSIYGITNRVNGVAGIGAVILVYGAFGVLGSLAAQALRQRGVVLGLAVTLILACLLGVGYLTAIRRHIGIWNSAYAAEAAALKQIKTTYPELPDGTTLFATGYPAYQTLGVPILSTGWDLDGMIKDEYENSSLGAFPLLAGYEFSCRPSGLAVEVAPTPEAPRGELLLAPVPYRSALLIDVSGRRARLADQAECRAEIEDFKPGPLYLSSSY